MAFVYSKDAPGVGRERQVRVAAVGLVLEHVVAGQDVPHHHGAVRPARHQATVIIAPLHRLHLRGSEQGIEVMYFG